MIERVARALFERDRRDMRIAGFRRTWEATTELWRKNYREKARTAIEAMREPDERMIAAGRPYAEVYQTMIDAALEEAS